MLVRFVPVIIDANHHVQRRRVFDGSRYDDPADPTVEVALKLVGIQEFTGAFEHNIASEIAPRHFGGCRCRGEPDAPIADQDGSIILYLERLSPAAMQAIELKEMRRDLRATLHFVDVHHIEPIAGARIVGRTFHRAERRPQGQASNAAHAVYADTHVLQTARSRINAAIGP
jgi:hypothetical protein